MLNLTVSMVSFRSPLTLAATLASYVEHGLLEVAAERRIVLQEPVPDQVTWATHFGFKAVVVDGNIGVGRSCGELISRCTTEYILFLEEDWLLVEPRAVVESQLASGIQLLQAEPRGVVRYRHRWDYGEPLYSLQFRGREQEHLTHLGECIHWREHPDRDFPDLITKLRVGEHDFYRLSSRNSCYTNNPVLYRTDFASEILLPFCFDDLEKPIQPWWEQQDFAVFSAPGLFRHSRVDR
jgi:hypothetical protein